MTQRYSDNYQREKYNVGIYCRISNEDSVLGESNSISNQKSILTKYVVDKDWCIIDYYIDDGYSGLNFDRPGFQKLLRDIQEGKISLVITKDMSRLGRDYILVGHYVEKFFPENRVRFIAINDNIDTGKEQGDNDITPFKAIINDMYSKDISKKVRSVLNMKRQEGKFIGPFAPYGYEKSPENKNKLIIDQNTAPIVKRIFEMYLSGDGLTLIAKSLNGENILCPAYYKKKMHETYSISKTKIPKWSHSSIKAILTNPVYTGSVAQNKYKKVNYKSKKLQSIDKKDWMIVKDTHESIVSQDIFDRVQKLMDQKGGNFEGAKKSTKLFSGMVFCGECGQYMTYTSTQADKVFLICSTYKRYGKELCSRHAILEGELENIILNDYWKLVHSFSNKGALMKKAEKMLNARKDGKNFFIHESISLQNRLEQINILLKAVYEDKVKGLILESQFVEFYEEFNEEKKNLKKRQEELLKKLDSDEKKQCDEEQIERLLDSVLNLKKLNPMILAALVEKIEICEGQNIKITYRIENPYGREMNHQKHLSL